MFGILDYIARRWGFVGLVNFNVAFGLTLSYLLIQFIKYRTILVWPTIPDILLIAFVAIIIDAWLIKELLRDWRDGSD